MLVSIDASENLSVYRGKGSKLEEQSTFSIKNAKGFPQELRGKELFGMGYPYYVVMYDQGIAFSSDYGIFYFGLKK